VKTIRQAYQGSLLPYAKYVTITILKNADTVTIRLLLALASVGFAACLMFGTDVFERPGYHLMRKMGGETAWSLMFMLHFAGVIWRVYDPVERIGWALLINSFGFVLWGVMTLLLNLALGSVTPGTALEWTLVLASGWALYRTGLHGEAVSA
jgi:hypothetical protein